MKSDERKAQLKTGIFMIIGLSMIALMVVYFGRLGDGMRSYYRLRIEYSNASGLLKGASVLLAGAKVGMVENSPTILPDMDGVYVNLKIYSDVDIPSKSEFTIGSSGLLGDRFVQIILLPDALKSPMIAKDDKAIIKGKAESGISDITEKAGALMADVQEAVNNIKAITFKINNEVLKESTMQDLTATMANLKQTSASFAETSKKIDGVVAQAEGVIKSGQETMVSAKGAADEIKKTVADVRGLVQQAKQGRGILGVLLGDKETADNFKALVANMKRHGVLWYKDRQGAAPER